MLGRLFGRREEVSRPAPAHAWDLGAGGFFKLGLAVPEGLAGADLQVKAVHALDLGGAGASRRVLELDALRFGALRMWRGEGDTVALARLAERAEVKRAFGLKKFGRLFDPEVPANVVLERRAEPAGFAGWTAAVYRQEAAHEAYRHDVDLAVTEIGDELSGARAFDFYRLVSDDRAHAVEVQVHDGGRTEVVFAALLAERNVEEIWPG